MAFFTDFEFVKPQPPPPMNRDDFLALSKDDQISLSNKWGPDWIIETLKPTFTTEEAIESINKATLAADELIDPNSLINVTRNETIKQIETDKYKADILKAEEAADELTNPYSDLNQTRVAAGVYEPRDITKPFEPVTFVDRLVYDSDDSWRTYLDINCSIYHNDTLYVGSRADISTIIDNNANHKTVGLDYDIPVRFLSVSNIEHPLCMVQNYASGFIMQSRDQSGLVSSGYMKIPYLKDVEWSTPFMKIKKLIDGVWIDVFDNQEDNTTTYGSGMLDAVAHNDDLYVLSVSASGDGTKGTLSTTKHAFTDKGSIEKIGVSTGYGGLIVLNETFNNVDNSTGFHRFYMYNHPYVPYVVHHQIEQLAESIGPDGVTESSNPNNYIVDTDSKANYLYNTVDISFCDSKEASTIKPFTKIIIDRDNNTKVGLSKAYIRDTNSSSSYYQVTDSSARFKTWFDSVNTIRVFDNINNEWVTASISIIESDSLLWVDLESSISKYEVSYVASSEDLRQESSRDNYKVVTSCALNKNIYLIMYNNNRLEVFKTTDYNEYNLYTPSSSGVPTYAGNAMGYVGDNHNLQQLDNDLVIGYSGIYNGNVKEASIDIKGILNDPNIDSVIGDQDDIVVKQNSSDYLTQRRYGSIEPQVVCNVMYVPLTFTIKGSIKSYNIILRIGGDGSIDVIKNNNKAVTITPRGIGRSHISLNKGKMYFTAFVMGLTEDFESAYENNTGNELLDNIRKDSQFNDNVQAVLTTQPNIWGEKNLLVGEYDLRPRDVLDIKEYF